MEIKIPFSNPKWTDEEQIVASLKNRGRNSTYYTDKLKNLWLQNSINQRNILHVNRGRSAIQLLLELFEIGRNDEVILPSYLCITVLQAIQTVKATPVFADIDKDLNISVKSVENKISKKTKAIIVPHLFGFPAAIDEIIQIAGPNIYVIDDAAQSYGSSLNGKLLGTFGDGGLIVCGPGKALAGPSGAVVFIDSNYNADALSYPNEPSWLVKLRYKRFLNERVHRKKFLNCSRSAKYKSEFIRLLMGVMNHYVYTGVYKMREIDAAIMFRQIESNHGRLQKLRKKNFKLFLDETNRPNFAEPLRGESFPVKMPLICSDGQERSELLSYLNQNGIEMDIPYVPIHIKDPLVEEKDDKDLAYTNYIWNRIIAFPLDESFENTTYIINKINAFYS